MLLVNFYTFYLSGFRGLHMKTITLHFRKLAIGWFARRFYGFSVMGLFCFVLFCLVLSGAELGKYPSLFLVAAAFFLTVFLRGWLMSSRSSSLAADWCLPIRLPPWLTDVFPFVLLYDWLMSSYLSSSTTGWSLPVHPPLRLCPLHRCLGRLYRFLERVFLVVTLHQPDSLCFCV